MSGKILVIDFDSTFVTLESLDELAKIALAENPQKDKILIQIKDVTRQGMEGEISFDQSLANRLALFQASRLHIEQLISLLRKNITKSVLRNGDLFKFYEDKIYIISGGFKEYILPVVIHFGIQESHVIANEFMFDSGGRVTGFHTSNYVCQKGGKAKAVRSLNLTDEIVVIGDGYTDYEIKEKGAANVFYAFTENIRRGSVVRVADREIQSFDEIFSELLPLKSIKHILKNNSQD